MKLFKNIVEVAYKIIIVIQLFLLIYRAMVSHVDTTLFYLFIGEMIFISIMLIIQEKASMQCSVCGAEVSSYQNYCGCCGSRIKIIKYNEKQYSEKVKQEDWKSEGKI